MSDQAKGDRLPYGRCPECGEPGELRERRPGGNDRCTAGHWYPSRLSVVSPAKTPDVTVHRCYGCGRLFEDDIPGPDGRCYLCCAVDGTAADDGVCPKCGGGSVRGLMAAFWVELDDAGEPLGRWEDYETNTELSESRECGDCGFGWKVS